MTFSGDGAKYLSSVFFTPDCTGQQAEVDCKVYIDCCERWFDFVITYEGVEWCEADCTVSVDLQRSTDETEAYRYLSDTIFWQNGFVDAFTHPKIYYCNQPGFLQFALISLFGIIGPIIVLLTILVDIVKAICEVVSFGFGRCDLGAIEDVSVCSLFEIIGGCGRYAPSPLIKDILEFNASQAGITLESSIFQEQPYSNTALFQLQYERGIGSGNWIEDNAANLTTIQLLNQLKDVFNLDYRITDGKLIVEREDYFTEIATDIGVVSECVTFLQDNACAYGDYAYTEDPVDQQGNRLRSNYDDVIEFNEDAEMWKKGVCEVKARFGRARFMFDQRGFDRPDDVPGGDVEPFLGDNFIDRFRRTNILNIAGCRDDRRERDLVISNNRAGLLKLIVLEEGFNREDAFAIRKQIGSRNGLTFWAYNYPMYFAEDEPEGLYHRFHIIDNPNNGGRVIYEMSEAELTFSCDLINIIEGASAGYRVQTSLGPGIAETVEVDFGAKTIKAKNIKIKC